MLNHDNNTVQDASARLTALMAKPGAKPGWLSRQAIALGLAVMDNLIFSVVNISLKYREFVFAVVRMEFKPNAESASDALFSKQGTVTGLTICCSALGSDAMPLLSLPKVEFDMTKGNSDVSYTMVLRSHVVKVEAQPIALRIAVSALSGQPPCFYFNLTCSSYCFSSTQTLKIYF
jgi:hypothetical protein